MSTSSALFFSVNYITNKLSTILEEDEIKWLNYLSCQLSLPITICEKEDLSDFHLPITTTKDKFFQILQILLLPVF